MPVAMMAAVVMAGMASASSVNAIPIAVVMLLGNSDTVSVGSRPNSAPPTSTIIRQAIVPAVTPAQIAGRLRRSSRSWLCRGIARHTVDGVNSQDKEDAARLVCCVRQPCQPKGSQHQ